ncbi:MAG: STAS domain-containing protein [Pseudonocardia sp.]
MVHASTAVGDWMRSSPADVLRWAAHYPTQVFCVLALDGEVDLLTAPLFDDAVREQLAASPGHLIVDLTQVRFMGASGLRCLLEARDLAQLRGSQLHLAGLANRAVARPLQICALLGLFDTHSSLAEALNTLAR